MKLLLAITLFNFSACPALSFDLTDRSYIGLDKATIKSTYSCAPSFLILGGGTRLVCYDTNADKRALVFILSNEKVVNVDITPQDPPLIFNEAISSLQSQCEAGEDNVTFKCKNGTQAVVRDVGSSLTINLCLQGHC